MRQIESLNRADWERIGAATKFTYLMLCRYDCLISRSIGKSHDTALKIRRLCTRMNDVKSEVDDLVYDYGSDLFTDNEIGNIVYGQNVGRQEEYLKHFVRGEM